MRLLLTERARVLATHPRSPETPCPPPHAAIRPARCSAPSCPALRECVAASASELAYRRPSHRPPNQRWSPSVGAHPPSTGGRRARLWPAAACGGGGAPPPERSVSLQPVRPARMDGRTDGRTDGARALPSEASDGGALAEAERTGMRRSLSCARASQCSGCYEDCRHHVGRSGRLEVFAVLW